MHCWFRLATPPPSSSGGAIGLIELGGDAEALLARLGIRPVGVGRAVLREWPGVDTIVAASVAPGRALLFPHAGPAVVRRAIKALTDAGARPTDDPTPAERYPEARSLLEARMLDALARALSPLAVDLLLDQPRRWAAAEGVKAGAGAPSLCLPDGANRILCRLIDAPLVVALGGPNIGKSSVLNALAGRGVSIVADAPGTTRDHVGVSLDLAGLVVRYIDTPGVGPIGSPHDPDGVSDREAQAIALRIAADADLLLLCADATCDFLPPPPTPTIGAREILRVGLRADLGPPPTPCDVSVSVRNTTGLEGLTRAIRDRLVPPALLADPRAWAFW